MYLQGQIFIVDISNIIRFTTIQNITDKNIPLLNRACDNTFRVYNQPGFQNKRIHVGP